MPFRAPGGSSDQVLQTIGPGWVKPVIELEGGQSRLKVADLRDRGHRRRRPALVLDRVDETDKPNHRDSTDEHSGERFHEELLGAGAGDRKPIFKSRTATFAQRVTPLAAGEALS